MVYVYIGCVYIGGVYLASLGAMATSFVQHPAASSNRVDQAVPKISRSLKDQCNIDPRRHADAGSTACPLIAATGCIFALFKNWKPNEACEFEKLMHRSVTLWDSTGATNGSPPADVLQRTATKYLSLIHI